MLANNNFYAKINWKNIDTIISKIYQIIGNDKNILEGKVCEDTDLGTISFSVLKSEIKIEFSKVTTEFYILKQYIYLINEKKPNNKILIFTKSDLEKAFKDYSTSHNFLIDNIAYDDITKILEKNPEKIILRLKEDTDISKEIFYSLNKKYDISEEDSILMKTNELTSQNIYSLGIYRDKEISLVLKKRNKLINEIKDFMNTSEEVIMKIYGVDGIGKSMTFIYLTSLKNDFKIIYFNLKEFFLKENLELMNLFKAQLTSYYNEEIKENDKENENEMINKYSYNDYLKAMKEFDKKITYEKEINFWYLMNIFLEMISNNYRIKVLLIIDQYKIENDKENNLYGLEKYFINNISSIKLLVVSSLNDMRVKTEFIGILKNFSNLKSNQKIKKIEITRDETDSTMEEKKIDDIFSDFSENMDIEEEDDPFTKIKKFNDLNVDNKKENIKINDKNNSDINENMYFNSINNYFINQNLKMYKDNKKYRIIYINDLISIKDMKDENKDIINKLKEFNYNPKYYQKLKNNVNSSVQEKSLQKEYNKFLLNQFENIKSKIIDFYEKFSKKFNINLKDRDIGLVLIQLRMIVEEKIELDFDSLIHYLNKFPIKYLKIIKIGDNEDKSFLRLNKMLSNDKFMIDYIFPFFKFVINRLLYEYGNNRFIKCSDLPPSGIGSFLEKQIRKGILIHKIFNNFNSRNFWNFQISLYKNSKLKKIKGKKKIKKDSEIKENETGEKKKEEEEKEKEEKKKEEEEKEKEEKKKEEEEKEKEEKKKEEGVKTEKEKIEEEEKEKEEKKKEEEVKTEKEKIEEEEEEEEEEDEEEKEKLNQVEEAKKEKKEEENIKIKIDFFNLKELTYDDIIQNPLDDYNSNYYIICHSPNNRYLDSLILIPCSQDNESEKIFNLIGLQITINKMKIYELNEYHTATEIAAQKISSTYDIKIKDKFFCFILSEEYENKTTQQNLEKLGIPFAFFSTVSNCFFLETKKKIESISQFLRDEFKLQINQNKKESVFYKNNIFKKMEDYLQKKRKRDKKFKVTKNSFHFIKEKMFKEEKELTLPMDELNTITKTINSTEFFKNKKIIIEYIFKVNFFEYENLYSCNDDLIGICFYKKNIFLFNKKLGSRIKILSTNQKEKKTLNDLLNYINDNIEINIDKDNDYSSNNYTFDNLMKYNLNKPSEIFVFAIYEIK